MSSYFFVVTYVLSSTLVGSGTKGTGETGYTPSEPLLKVNFGCTDTLSLLFRLTFLNALSNLSSLLKNRMIHRVDSLYIGLSASFFANLTFIV